MLLRRWDTVARCFGVSAAFAAALLLGLLWGALLGCPLGLVCPACAQVVKQLCAPCSQVCQRPATPFWQRLAPAPGDSASSTRTETVPGVTRVANNQNPRIK